VIVDLTEQRKQYLEHPCTFCEIAWCSLEQWVDKNNGHVMEETMSCHKDCDKIKQFNQLKKELNGKRKKG
jgi:hypothetical protein